MQICRTVVVGPGAVVVTLDCLICEGFCPWIRVTGTASLAGQSATCYAAFSCAWLSRCHCFAHGTGRCSSPPCSASPTDPFGNHVTPLCQSWQAQRRLQLDILGACCVGPDGLRRPASFDHQCSLICPGCIARLSVLVASSSMRQLYQARARCNGTQWE